VIKTAIYDRYDLIHYIYGLFQKAATKAEPILQAMWYQFPKESKYLSTETQFMFGESLLVCPKLTPPSNATTYHSFEVYNCDLPAVDSDGKKQTWYSYQLPSTLSWCGRNCGPFSGQTFDVMNLTDKEQGIFVRGGSIIAKPFYRDYNLKSVTQMLAGKKISLEVYLDVNGEAEGELYLDDGTSFDYRDECKYSHIKYTFKNKTLSASRQSADGCHYDGAADTGILYAYIFGPEKAGINSKEGLKVKDVIHDEDVDYLFMNRAYYLGVALSN